MASTHRLERRLVAIRALWIHFLLSGIYPLSVIGCSDAVRRNILEIAPTISRGLCRLSAAPSETIVDRQRPPVYSPGPATIPARSGVLLCLAPGILCRLT